MRSSIDVERSQLAVWGPRDTALELSCIYRLQSIQIIWLEREHECRQL